MGPRQLVFVQEEDQFWRVFDLFRWLSQRVKTWGREESGVEENGRTMVGTCGEFDAGARR